MAARKTRPTTIKPLDVTHTLASAKPHTCGEAFTVLTGTFGEKADLAPFAAEGCKRLPRHNGEHKADKPRGLMTKAQRAKASAARLTKAARQPKVASKVITFGDTKLRVFADGRTEPVAPEATPEPPKAARKPRVRTVPMADSPRRVAAPAKVTRRSAAAPNGTKSRSNAGALKGRIAAK